MTHPCYAEETYVDTSASRVIEYNRLNYLEYKRKRLVRQQLIKKKQRETLKRFIIFVVCMFVSALVLLNLLYSHVYLPVVNSNINITVEPVMLRGTQAMFSEFNLFNNIDDPKSGILPSSGLMKSLPLNKEIKELEDQLIPVVSSDPNYSTGLFIWDSYSNNYVSINGHDAYPTASIIKIPVLIELFRQIDKKMISSIENKVQTNMYHLAEGSGDLQYRPLGNSYSLDYLASIMIGQSDNTATNILLDEIGGADVLNKIMQAWGIQNGHMANWLPDLYGTNVMAPADYAKMLYNINNPQFLSSASTGKILDYMSHIKNRNLISSGMPAGSTIAHKTGDIGEMVGDAGIVTLPNGRQIIMVAMVKRPWNSYKAKDIIREASRVTFNYFSTH